MSFNLNTGVRPTVETGPGEVKQSFRDECDVNFIMARYEKTGMMNFVSGRKPEYLDVDAIDFQTAMQTVLDGQEMFADMPAKLRREFNDDPGQFLAFVHDPANADRLVELGLATAKEVEEMQSKKPPAAGGDVEPEKATK